MPQILGQGWFDENADRSFPLVDGVSRISNEGFVLPNDLLVDLRLTAATAYDPTAFYVSATSGFGTGLVITIAVDGVGDIASITVPLGNFTDFSSYTIAPLPGHDVGGSAVIGHAAAAMAASTGAYTFPLAATRILPTCIYPTSSGVSSITVVDAFGAQSRLTGAVVIAAGTNATLSASGQILTFSMDTGVVLDDPCGTDPGGTRRNPVRSISGVSPDVNGNIQLLGTDCMAISPISGGVKLKDDCAQPCCSSNEINSLVDAVKLINTNISTLANGDAQLEQALRTVMAYVEQ